MASTAVPQSPQFATAAATPLAAAFPDSPFRNGQEERQKRQRQRDGRMVGAWKWGAWGTVAIPVLLWIGTEARHQQQQEEETAAAATSPSAAIVVAYLWSLALFGMLVGCGMKALSSTTTATPPPPPHHHASNNNTNCYNNYNANCYNNYNTNNSNNNANQNQFPALLPFLSALIVFWNLSFLCLILTSHLGGMAVIQSSSSNSNNRYDGSESASLSSWSSRFGSCVTVTFAAFLLYSTVFLCWIGIRFPALLLTSPPSSSRTTAMMARWPVQPTSAKSASLYSTSDNCGGGSGNGGDDGSCGAASVVTQDYQRDFDPQEEREQRNPSRYA